MDVIRLLFLYQEIRQVVVVLFLIQHFEVKLPIVPLNEGQVRHVPTLLFRRLFEVVVVEPFVLENEGPLDGVI